MDKFQKGDKVVKVGTKTPIMTIDSKTFKGGLPNYSEKENFWTCKFEKNGFSEHREEFNESELELFVNTKEV